MDVSGGPIVNVLWTFQIDSSYISYIQLHTSVLHMHHLFQVPFYLIEYICIFQLPSVCQC